MGNNIDFLLCNKKYGVYKRPSKQKLLVYFQTDQLSLYNCFISDLYLGPVSINDLCQWFFKKNKIDNTCFFLKVENNLVVVISVKKEIKTSFYRFFYSVDQCFDIFHHLQIIYPNLSISLGFMTKTNFPVPQQIGFYPDFWMSCSLYKPSLSIFMVGSIINVVYYLQPALKLIIVVLIFNLIYFYFFIDSFYF